MTPFRHIATLITCLLFAIGPIFVQGVVAPPSFDNIVSIDGFASGSDTYTLPVAHTPNSFEIEQITQDQDNGKIEWLFRFNGPHVIVPAPMHVSSASQSDAIALIPMAQHTGSCSGLAPPAYS